MGVLPFFSSRHRIIQFYARDTTLKSRPSIFLHILFWKQRSFLSFQKDQRAAEEIILTFKNLLLLNQQMPIDSKDVSITLPTTEEILHHICLATTQSKKRWKVDSSSPQNKQVLS
jgi:hypothetical protein